jgi:chromosome condensin MukBEF MukE localization factor
MAEKTAHTAATAPAATRERKLKFMHSFGRKALETAIMEAVHRFGVDNFLTDEQLEEIVSVQVSDARTDTRRRVRNRRIARIYHDTEDRSEAA